MADLIHRPQDAFGALVRRACERFFPGIGRYDRLVYGKGRGIAQQSGQVTGSMKLWSCDIELLNLNLAPDTTKPILKDVPLDPIQLNQAGAAMFSKPFVGLIVRVGWMGANRAFPYIHSFTAEGQMVPQGNLGELSDLLYQAIQLLAQPRQTAVGPGPYDPGVQAQLLALLQRIPT